MKGHKGTDEFDEGTARGTASGGVIASPAAGGAITAASTNSPAGSANAAAIHTKLELFRESFYNFNQAVATIQYIADVIYGGRGHHNLRDSRKKLEYLHVARWKKISIRVELRGELSKGEHDPAQIIGAQILRCLERHGLLPKLDHDMLDKKFKGKKVADDDLFIRDNFTSKLLRFYRSQNKLPKLIEDPAFAEQDIEEYYMTLQVILDGTSKQVKAQDYQYESINAAKETILLENLFATIGDRRRVRRVLLLGRAGVGKTTLMHYIAYKWAQRELYRDRFDYVFRVRLRDLTSNWEARYSQVLQTGSCDELTCFMHYCLKESKGMALEEVAKLESVKDRILLLLDGYDEVAHLNTDDTSIVYRVMQQIFNYSNIIMTSRPNAIDTDSALARQFVRRIETIGLDQEGIKQYVKLNSINLLDQVSLLQFLRSNKLALEACATPINLVIICLVWNIHESRARLGNDFLMSDLYNEMMLYLGKRYLKNSSSVLDIANITKIEHIMDEPVIIALEQLAFAGFKTGKLALDLPPKLIDQIVGKKMIKNVHAVGLLKADTNDRTVIDFRHEFIHLSFQEYLVAQHLKRVLQSNDQARMTEAAEFIAEYKYQPRLLNTLKFLAGLISKEQEEGLELETRFWECITCNRDGYIEFDRQSLIKLALQLLPYIGERAEADSIANRKLLIQEVIDAVTNDLLRYAEDFTLARYPEYITSLVIPKLLEIFKNYNVQQSEAAAQILTKLGNEQIVDDLFKFIKNRETNANRKIKAIKILEEVGGKAIAVLHEIIAKQEASFFDIKVAAIESIGVLGLDTSVPVLIAKLSDHDSRVRRATTVALARIGAAAVELLIVKLSDFDSNVRSSAAGALGEIGDVRAVEALITKLSDFDRNVRSSAARALGKGGAAAVESLIAKLDDPDIYIRSAAAEALGEIGDVRAAEPLIAKLGDSDTYAIRATAEALGKIGDVRAVEPLIAKLGNHDSSVRRAAVEALGKIGDAKAVGPLLAKLGGDSNNDVKSTAAEALGKIGKASVEPIISMLGNPDSHVRRAAAETLGKIGAAALEPLIAMLGDPDRDVRSSAAEALGGIGDARAVEPLIAKLSDPDINVRRVAVEALGKIGDVRAVEPLIVKLGDNSSYVIKLTAAEALGEIKDVRAVGPLISLFDDVVYLDDSLRERKLAKALAKIGAAAVEPLIAKLADHISFVRAAAVVALGEIGDVRAVEPLIAKLADHISFVRAAAAVTLGKIGDVRAVESLIAKLGDPDSDVRSSAAGALGEIGDVQAVGPLTSLMRSVWSGHTVDIVRDTVREALARIARKQSQISNYSAVIKSLPSVAVVETTEADGTALIPPIIINSQQSLCLIRSEIYTSDTAGTNLVDLAKLHEMEKEFASQIKSNLPQFINTGSALPLATYDIPDQQVRSFMVGIDLLLSQDAVILYILHDTEIMLDGERAVSFYCLLETRSVFGDRLLIKISADEVRAIGNPKLHRPIMDKAAIDAYRGEIFGNLHTNLETKFYVTSTIISREDMWRCIDQAAQVRADTISVTDQFVWIKSALGNVLSQEQLSQLKLTASITLEKHRDLLYSLTHKQILGIESIDRTLFKEISVVNNLLHEQIRIIAEIRQKQTEQDGSLSRHEGRLEMHDERFDHHSIKIETVETRVGNIGADFEYLRSEVFIRLEALQKKFNATDQGLAIAKEVMEEFQREQIKLGRRVNLNDEQIEQLFQDVAKGHEILAEIQTTIQGLDERVELSEGEVKQLYLDVHKLSSYASLLESLEQREETDQAREAEIKAIEADTYKQAFCNAMRWNLNATYFAAQVVQTDIVQNASTGYVGKAGAVLSMAGGHIPLVGIGVKLLGKIMQKIDSNMQVKLLQNYAHFVRDGNEMAVFAERIAREMLREIDLSSNVQSADNLFTSLMKKAVDVVSEVSEGDFDKGVETALGTVSAVTGAVGEGVDGAVRVGGKVGIAASSISLGMVELLQSESTSNEHMQFAERITIGLQDLTTKAASVTNTAVSAISADADGAAETIITTTERVDTVKEYAARFFGIKKKTEVEKLQALGEKHAEIISNIIIKAIFKQKQEIFAAGGVLDDMMYSKIIAYAKKKCVKEDKTKIAAVPSTSAVGVTAGSASGGAAASAGDQDAAIEKAKNIALALIDKARGGLIYNNTEKVAKFTERLVGVLLDNPQSIDMTQQQRNQLASNLIQHGVFKFKTKGWKRQKAFSIDCNKLERDPDLLNYIVDAAINEESRPTLTVEQYRLERHDDGVKESKTSPDSQEQDQSYVAIVGIAAGGSGEGHTHVGALATSSSSRSRGSPHYK